MPVMTQLPPKIRVTKVPATPFSPVVPSLAGERLSKRVMQLKACSRREAEQYIEGGWVTVDGQVVEAPMARVTHHSVWVDPQASLMALHDVTLLLHKPPGFDAMGASAQQLLQAANHAADDESGLRVLKHHFVKLSACVPLETGASGLVVFTQDWRVLRKLTVDAAMMEHELLVEVQGTVSPDLLQCLNSAPASEHQSLPEVRVSINSTGDASTRLRFAVKGSHPGLIAWLCERAGLHITAMKRLRIGRVGLAHLPPGQWRYLLPHERF